MFNESPLGDDPSETLIFLSVELRLSGLMEMLISHFDNTTQQLARCSHWYKERARQKLCPSRKSLTGLSRNMRQKIFDTAIEMATEDSRTGAVVPPLDETRDLKP